MAFADESDDRCREDGKSVVIVIEVTISVTKLEPIIQEECEKPKCARDQYYDSSDRKCRYHSLPKDQASSCKRKGGRPICARSPQDWCDFGKSLSSFLLAFSGPLLSPYSRRLTVFFR